MRFDRPLSLTDKGVYECIATNIVGSGKVDMEIEVTGMDLFFGNEREIYVVYVTTLDCSAYFYY